MYTNVRPYAHAFRKEHRKMGIVCMFRRYYFAGAMQAHDLWRPVKGAEHNYDAAVLLQVCNGFYAAACQVLVSDGVTIYYTERVKALGGTVDMPFLRQWC